VRVLGIGACKEEEKKFLQLKVKVGKCGQIKRQIIRKRITVDEILCIGNCDKMIND
jgi:hypothetical protein